MCYPSHTTHVYQGLDVVVFAVLKKCWSEERDKWEREKGEGITKSNFITIYGQAHLRALTPDLIRMAFRKTGVWPFNPTVISEQMMAPSKETSYQGHLPFEPYQSCCQLPTEIGKHRQHNLGDSRKRHLECTIRVNNNFGC